jgi:hypothetical protein
MENYTLTVTEELDTPDDLYSGHEVQPVKATVSIASGVLTRGAVLGKITSGGAFIRSASAASDGSQTPYAILLQDVDASGGAVNALVLLAGIVNPAALNFGTGHTAATVLWPLREVGIYLRSTVGA